MRNELRDRQVASIDRDSTSGPVVSVVIPVHNNATTLEAQLEGVASGLGDAPPTELIVVDNRSTDGSVSVARSWSEHSGIEVRIVDASDRAGEPYARNRGFEEARGDLVLFCDGDDIVDPSWVSAMASKLKTEEYVTGEIDMAALNEAWLANVRGRSVSEGMSTLYGVVPYAHGCNMGFRRELLTELGGFDESLLAGCDLDIAIRAWRAGVHLAFQPSASIAYRLRPTLAENFRQGRTYGRYGIQIRNRLTDVVDRREEVTQLWRRRFWLLRHVPGALLSRSTRARWVWVMARQVGEWQGRHEVGLA